MQSRTKAGREQELVQEQCPDPRWPGTWLRAARAGLLTWLMLAAGLMAVGCTSGGSRPWAQTSPLLDPVRVAVVAGPSPVGATAAVDSAAASPAVEHAAPAMTSIGAAPPPG